MLLVVLVLVALDTTAAQAQAPAPFTRMGFGARGIAMSNALVADAFGNTSPYYNPALAPFTTRQNIAASAAYLSLDRELQFLQFAARLKPRAGVAAGLIHAGVSDIDGRDSNGYHTDTYSTDEYAFFLTFGLQLSERVSVGTSLQVFYVDYFDGLNPTKSIGLDLGLVYQPVDALRLGFALDDLLARYEWDTSDIYGQQGRTNTDRFPVRLRLGAAYALMDGRALVAAEYESRLRSAEERIRGVDTFQGLPNEVTETNRLQLHGSRLRLGAEFRLADPFAVRVGVDGLGADALDATMPSGGFMVEQAIGELVARLEYAVMMEPYAVGAMHFGTLTVFL